MQRIYHLNVKGDETSEDYAIEADTLDEAVKRAATSHKDREEGALDTLSARFTVTIKHVEFEQDWV